MRTDSLFFQGAILKYLPSIINDIQTVFDPVKLRYVTRGFAQQEMIIACLCKLSGSLLR